jgi:hypothetical protein
MNLNQLCAILDECTVELRNGPEMHEREEGTAPQIFMNGGRADLEEVDLWFLVVGVDKARAQARKAQLKELLKTYPEPAVLTGGLFSYITVTLEIGDRSAVFRLFALGKVLGLWDVITPVTLGLHEERAHDAAGRGFVMCAGFQL